jgi:hypothetical protein
MAARKRPQTLELLTEESEPKIRAPTLDECHDYVEAVSSAFDPKRVLLRRVFFLNEGRSKYVSICYLPARNYKLMVKFCSVRNNPVILTEPQVRYLV